MSNNNDIKSKIGTDNIEKIKTLFKKIRDTTEFEFIFFSKRDKHHSLTLEKYIALLKFLTKRASINKKLDLKGDLITMDISYNPDKETSYRCTLENKETIDKYMKKLSSANNHVIFRNLVAMSAKDKNITVLKKAKNSDETIDIDDFYMRVRSSEELNIDKKELTMLMSIDETSIKNISIRFKERTSLYVLNSENSYVKIDLTITKTESSYNNINSSIPRYELEIETKSNEKANMELLDTMFSETEILFKILQQSNFIISRSESEKVIQKYKELLIVPAGSQYDKSLYGRQPISLEIQYVSLLSNKYAVTDKADGERNFLVILFNHVYLINKNLDVKDTGIVLTKENMKYDNSVVDGELIFLKNRHVFLVFDCLFNGGNDVRKIVKLEERLQHADDIINNCFVLSGQKGMKYENLDLQKVFNLDKTLEFHKKQIKKMFDNLNHDIEIEKKMLLVRRKYFIHSLGAKPWEIYAYSSLLWNLYTSNSDIKCPYILDGLIFQPNDQAYVSEKKNSKYHDYKWKPPQKNSVDFYIEFVKDKFGNILTVYDNSYDDVVEDHTADTSGVVRLKNQNYKICKLYVGQMIGKKQAPLPFKENEDLHETYLLLKDGEVRDEEGNILSDKTVVEFYYNMAPEISNKFRWVPMRTRYDKTEAVIKYHEQYGNFSTTADNVWKSINNPVLMTDFDDLAKGNDPDKNIYFYDKKIESLNNRIDHEQIMSATKENAYFQKISNLAKPMRSFHNHIKDNLIYTFCHSMYDNKKKGILDIGIGKNQDAMKYYYAQVAYVVGIDIDKEGLMSPLDGAVSRYNKLKRKPGFPKMYFIQADFNTELEYEEQFRSLKGMSSDNKELMNKFFSKEPASRTLFDVISSQFSFHYGLKDHESFANLKKNINNYLRNDGHLIITTFDAQKVRELLKDKDKYTQEYTDENGNVQVLFEIKKKYQDVSDDIIMGVGNTIEMYMSWFMIEGNYQPEYLVDGRFLIEELSKDCDMDLITTNSFENQYILEKDFFTKYSQFEADERTRSNFFKIAEFYKSNSINDACKVYTNLERFYVFRKRKYGNKKQKGGDFTNPGKFHVPLMTSYNKNNDCSLMNSIHHVLRSHQVIPQILPPSKFYSDMNLDMKDDDTIMKGGNLKKVCKNIVIYHENANNKKEKVLDGINLLFVERDCNNEFDTKFVENTKGGSRTIILLKEGQWYAPIYSIDEKTKEKNGLFDTNELKNMNLIDEKN